MLQKWLNPEWQITSKSVLLSSFLIGFSFSPTVEISRLFWSLSLKKVCRGKPRQFSKMGLDRSQMEQPIEKNKFSYFARSRLRLHPQQIWERDYSKSRAQFAGEQGFQNQGVYCICKHFFPSPPLAPVPFFAGKTPKNVVLCGLRSFFTPQPHGNASHRKDHVKFLVTKNTIYQHRGLSLRLVTHNACYS